MSAWEDLQIAADEYRELDSGRVLVLLRYIGRGKTSGVDLGGMEATGAGAFHVHGDQVTSLAMYWDRDRALADLGLPAGGRCRRRLTDDQRGIRSSGKPIKIVEYAQGWQGVESGR